MEASNPERSKKVPKTQHKEVTILRKKFQYLI
jgi:hypothetical protein